jgi:hypothetical protein
MGYPTFFGTLMMRANSAAIDPGSQAGAPGLAYRRGGP